MKLLPVSIAVALGSVAAASLVCAAEVKITLPPETGTLKPGPGVELAQANCLTCHSVEYISTQPPMPKAFWEASVKKMREKYGAPTPDDAVQKLVEYLAATYGAPIAAKP
jgi:mono/diheme cytochrome c family protein